jgi:hypothetical protein
MEDQMSAAAPRIAQHTPDLRRLGAALAALALAIALLFAAALSQQGATRSSTVPVAGAAPIVRGNGFDQAHAIGSATQAPHVVIGGTYRGVLRRSPMPSPAAGRQGTGGSNGTRFAR